MATKRNTVQDVNLTTSLGGAPAAGDDVLIDKWALTYSGGTDLSAVSLNTFTNQPESRCIFTGPGELTLKLTTGTLTNSGQGERFDVRSIGATTVIQTIVLKPQAATCVQQLKQLQATTIVCVTGITFLTDTVNVATVNVFGGTLWIHPDNTGTYPITAALNVWDGAVTLSRDLPAMTVYGGSVTVNDTAVSPSGTVTVNGGKLSLQTCGNINQLDANAGTIDMARLSSSITIGTANWRPGCVVLKSRQTVEPTIAVDNAPYGRPRIVYVD